MGESQTCWQLLEKSGLDANIQRGPGPRFTDGMMLEMPSFIRLLRTLTIDQSFWMPLLPPLDPEGVAVVIDDSCGNLTRSIARHFRQVISLQSDPNAAELIERTLSAAGIDNAKVLQVDLSKPLPIDPQSVTLAVCMRVGRLLCKRHGEKSYQAVYQRLLNSLQQLLTADGAMLVADDNSQNYFHLANLLLRRPAPKYHGVSWSASRRTLREAGLHLQEYVGKFSYSEGLLPLPDLATRAHAAHAEPLKKKLVARAKQYLLSRHLSTRFWPAFMFCASKRLELDSVLGMIQQAALAEQMGWASNSVEVKRVIAGNFDVTVVIAGPADSEQDVVIRMPRSKVGFGSTDHNARVLQALPQEGPFAELAPRLLASGEYRGQAYYIEEKKAGKELQEHGADADQMLREASLVLARGQARTAERVRINSEHYANLVSSCVEHLLPFCTEVEQTLLWQVDAKLKQALIGTELPLVRTHGDFKLGNVLFLDDQSVGAIIDWDLSEERGLPLLDLFVLLTYRKEPGNRDCTLVGFFCDVVLPWKVRPFYQELLTEYSQILGVGEELHLPLRALSWLMNLRDRLDWTLKSHEGWASAGIGSVLEKINDSLPE